MTASSNNWRPSPDKYPLAYRRLEIRYVNGEVVTGVIATAEGEWQSDDIDNIMPPLGGHWRYEERKPCSTK
jgi:hypothetical protein